VRFQERREGGAVVTDFYHPPKAQLRAVAYDRPPKRLLFELRRSDDPAVFRSVPQERVVDVAKSARDRAAQRLKQELPGRAAEIDRIIIGRNAGIADIGRRVRFVPLPSIGMPYTDPSVRRVVVEIPPDCPFAADELSWALSGQNPVDPETGEIFDDTIYAAMNEDEMLRHYVRRARRWQTVTPVALPYGRRCGRLHGVDWVKDQRLAVAAVADALRHAGWDWRGIDVRIQAFHRKGARADAFHPDRFAGRLRHVEVTFPEPVPGPLVIGDGRWLGLGIMAPAREEEAPALHLFVIDPAGRPPASAGELVAKSTPSRRDGLGRRGAHT
jgi:CRISPR-associated protein Csb2